MKFNPETTSKLKIEFFAVTKDGSKIEKLKDYEEAKKAKETGKATFWYKYVDGTMKYECFEFPCDVYEKHVTTITKWKKYEI